MQYGNIFKTTGAALFIGLLLFLNAIGFFGQVNNFFVAAFAPLLTAARGFQNINPWNTLSRAEAEKINSENRKLVSENFRMQELEQENRSLKKALAIREEKNLSLIPARIFYYGQELGKEYIFVERGARDGVKNGSRVIDEDGFLIGFVREVYGEIARITLASNPGEEFEGEVLPSRIRILVKGLGNRTFLLTLIPGEAAIQKEDLVIFSGISGIRASHPLGKISTVRSRGGSVFKEASVILFSQPERLKNVLIISADKLP